MATRTEMRVSGTQGAVVTLSMYVNDCPSCGVIFGITTDYEDRRRKDGQGFRCPNGHVMSFSETEADRLRKQARELERRLEREAADREFYQQQLRSERAGHKKTANQLRATKGVVTRTKKRAAAALCPVEGCGRSFVQLRRHLSAKHPGYDPMADHAHG